MRIAGFSAAMAVVCAVGMSSASFADSFPNKPIRLIVPYTAGGQTDILGRALGKELSAALGQPVVIENHTGAGGNIGMDMVVKATPDGYTLGLGTNGPLAGNATLYKDLPYNPAKDFSPVTRIALVPNVLVVHPSLPVRNVNELIALLKENPQKYSYASGGSGTTQHLGAELFKLMTDASMAHVPYRGEGAAMSDVLAGRVPIFFVGPVVGVPYVEAGKLRALAVTSKERSPALPDVPTMIEAGVPDYVLTAWYGLVAPVGTPDAVIKKLNLASVKALNSSAIQERLAALGGTPAPGTSQEFGDFIRSEILRWADLIQRTDARSD
ncbi:MULTISPECIES: Bug family tripartite tricarboxylate transporter substrate binding protein [Alcaligenaceae]|uniref:Secreted protein n=1 Tax=Bordetella petrii (strain ATCC BAA-461 / DSM 12804 / CCUG 43448 / CIP 107267 / Se-1111R) TaxID=340100 RepID=A9ICA3_BORPD|nr:MULTISPECIES: tripartite tricarboxylate transporter substrate binding protein [Alcaligenaceae]CAP41543.1 putative secreted protein [Bordetella petrii]CUJ31008.1 Argininosuccinate lyase [Achromobacter xylosoxidans]CUJ71094.1 Argininosuccinate lyase [Achromobacter xylosoxidans]